MQGDVLLGYQPGPDTGAEVLVEEAGYLAGGDVFPALQEPPGENGDGVGVGLD